MDYSLSIEEFNKNFSVKENKLTHNSGKKFKLFPFTEKFLLNSSMLNE